MGFIEYRQRRSFWLAITHALFPVLIRSNNWFGIDFCMDCNFLANLLFTKESAIHPSQDIFK